MEVGADRHRGIGVYGAVAFLDVLHDAILVDNNVRALRPLIRFVLNVVALENAILLQHLLVHVAEQRELDIDLFGEGGVCGRTIHAYAEDFRVGGVDLACAYSRLDRLELLGSTTGEGENVDGKEHIFLTVKITELDGFPLIAKESEIGRGVANFERDLSDLVGFLGRRGWRCE